jgi:hypothetical protein
MGEGDGLVRAPILTRKVECIISATIVLFDLEFPWIHPLGGRESRAVFRKK